MIKGAIAIAEARPHLNEHSVRRNLTAAEFKRSSAAGFISLFAFSVITISFSLSSAIAQTPNQTAGQARQQLLQALDAGRLREAVLIRRLC